MIIKNPIIEIDVHGLTVAAAVKAVQEKVKKAGPEVYTIRVIHGFNGGTRIRSAIKEEFSFGREPKVKRVKPGENQGISELVLKELF